MKKTFTKGHWYIFIVKSDGTTVTLTEKDNIDASIVENKLVLPKGFTVAAFFYDLHTIEADKANVCNIIIDTDGLTIIGLPANNFDYGYMYIRGFFS